MPETKDESTLPCSGIGSFAQLSWRMDPEVSFSDWCIDVVRMEGNDVDAEKTTDLPAFLTTAEASDSEVTTNNPQRVKEELSVSASSLDLYHVHRNVLAVGPRHSEYFAAQFQSPMQESINRRTTIKLDSTRADAFPLLLDFMYTAKLPNPLTAGSAAALHSLSEYFDMPNLRQVVEDLYRRHLTMHTIVDFIQQAQKNHAEALLQIAIESSIQHLLEMTTKTVCLLGPELLLQILQANSFNGQQGKNTTKVEDANSSEILNETGKTHRRRFGFHVSKLIVACCRHHRGSLSMTTFLDLTEIEILPYLDGKAAVYLLSIEADFFKEEGISEDITQVSPSSRLTCLQQRCVQAITDKWRKIRHDLCQESDFNQAFQKIPSFVLIDLLMKTTSSEKLMNFMSNGNSGFGLIISSQSEDEAEDRETRDEAPPRILVRDAAIAEVNGLYSLDGRLFQGVPMYTRAAQHNGEPSLFSMFQCLVSSETKRWFISVIPSNGKPGTNKDIDFYSALVTRECMEVPPTHGWKKSSDGEEPAPTLLF